MLSEDMEVDRAMELTLIAPDVEDIRAARLSMKRYKTSGDDGVVPEMVMGAQQTEWPWAAAFNQRLANPGGPDHGRVLLCVG